MADHSFYDYDHSRDTDRYLLLSSCSSSSLVYDPAADLWSPLPQSSSVPGPGPDWSPCRAVVHKSAVYFLGNRSVTKVDFLTKYFLQLFRNGKISNDFYKLNVNQGCQLVEEEPFKDDRTHSSFSSCDGYLYLFSGGQVG